jgi:hypothetical protein
MTVAGIIAKISWAFISKENVVYCQVNYCFETNEFISLSTLTLLGLPYATDCCQHTLCPSVLDQEFTNRRCLHRILPTFPT